MESTNMLSKGFNESLPLYGKLCSYSHICEASKAIITSFGRMLSQCFYVLEPLHWCPIKKKVCSYSLIHEASKATIWRKCAHTPMFYTTERIQYSAPLSVSGAWRGTKIYSLYKELGWENSYYHGCDLANNWTMAIFM